MKRYQLKISLRWSEPLIWRRIIVDGDLLLSDLHQVIQTVMPWENAHLHQFEKNRVVYSESAEEWGYGIDYSKVRVSDLLGRVKQKMTYEYDFGDGWLHDIVVEKIVSTPNPMPRAEFVDGEGMCPPEDCGGIFGYMDLLKIINDPEDEEYEDRREWLELEDGETLDPADMGFSPQQMDSYLRSLWK